MLHPQLHRVNADWESWGILLVVGENFIHHLFFSNCVMIVTFCNRSWIVACLVSTHCCCM